MLFVVNGGPETDSQHQTSADTSTPPSGTAWSTLICLLCMTQRQLTGMTSHDMTSDFG